jgi:ribosomal protein L16 Arg81 hydroxylase
MSRLYSKNGRVVRPGDIIKLPAGTLHQSEALDGGAIYAIATRPPALGN